MELLLDTANLEAIKKYCDYYNIIGVTTNPTILSREEGPFFETYEAIRKVIGAEKQLHVQVTARNCEDMLKEAEAITSRLGKDVYIKVPVIEEGVKAMKLLKENGHNELVDSLFCEVNPIPVKTAMGLQGWNVGALRRPLSEMEPKNVARLQAAMEQVGISKMAD